MRISIKKGYRILQLELNYLFNHQCCWNCCAFYIIIKLLLFVHKIKARESHQQYNLYLKTRNMSIITIQFIFNIGSFIGALQEEMVGLQNELKLLCSIPKLNTYLYWKYKIKIIYQLQILPILQVIYYEQRN